jgi:hypothetical protein
MTKEQPMRIGFCFLAGALFGVPTTLMGSAADAHWHHHHRLRTAHFARPGVLVPPPIRVAPASAPKPEDHGASGTGDAFTKGGRNAGLPGEPAPTKTGREGAPGGIENASTGAPGEKTTPPNGHMKDLGPVDTGISAVPRLHSAKSDRARSAKTKFKIVPGHSLRAHPKLAPATVVRNAIGVPIHPHGTDNKGSQGKVPDQASPGGTPKAAAGNGGTGMARLGLQPQAANAVSINGPHSPATTTISHSSIGGSIMFRPTAAPGIIGGPAKNVVGALNGTTFHQRHQ